MLENYPLSSYLMRILLALQSKLLLGEHYSSLLPKVKLYHFTVHHLLFIIENSLIFTVIY